MDRWCWLLGMMLAAAGALGPAGVGQGHPVPTVKPGQVVQGTLTGEVVPVGSPLLRQWRLDVAKPGPVWIAVETVELIPDLELAPWDDPEQPVVAAWDRLGFNEYVKLEAAAGAYRLGFKLRAASPVRGAFVLRVSDVPWDLPSGSRRDHQEVAYFRRVLARATTGDEAPFTLAALDGLRQALRRQEQWAEVVKVATRAAAILQEYGQHREAAGWLEDRARAEARLGRPLEAVATCETAVTLRLKAGDRYQAALTLGWAYGTGARERGAVANRARKQRAIGLATRTEMPGHTLEDLSQVWRELACPEEAREALQAAREQHVRAGDVPGEARVTETLFALLLEADEEAEASRLVEETVVHCRDRRQEKTAIILLDHAGDAAGDRKRPVLAERLLRQALAMVNDEEEPRVAALIGRSLVTALQAQGRFRDAAAICGRAARLFQRLDDAVEEAVTWIELGYLQRKLGERDEALKSFRRARARAATARNPVVEGRAWNGEGCIYHDRREHEAAARAYERGFALAGPDGDPVLVGDLVRNRIAVHRALGDGEAATAAAREGALVLAARGEHRALSRVFFDLGYALKALGDHAGARAAFTRAAEACRAAGNRRDLGRALNETGNVRAAEGNYAQAISDYEQALNLARAADDAQLEAWVLFNLAYSHAYLGQHARAAEWFSLVVPVYERETGPTSRFGRFLLFVSDTFARAGRFTEALAYVERAAAILKDRGSPRDAVKAGLQLGDLALRLGRWRDALRAYAAVLVKASEEHFTVSVNRAVLGLDRALWGR